MSDQPLCEWVQRRKYETHRDWTARVMFRWGWTDTMYDGPFAYPSNGYYPLEWQSYTGTHDSTHFVTDYGDGSGLHSYAHWASNGRFKWGRCGSRVWWTVREFLADNACLVCSCDRCWDGESEDTTTGEFSPVARSFAVLR